MTRLTDIDRALALFAEGIAGHPYHVKSLREMPPELGAPWEAEGAAHDGRSLYLPESLTRFGDAGRDAGAYRVLALQQLGLREFGTYRFDMNAAIRRIPALRAWPRADDPRTSHFAAFFAGFPQPELARQVLHAIESARVRSAMEARYLGARRYQCVDVAAELRAALGRIAPRGEELAPLAMAVCRPGADVYASAAATLACCDALGAEEGPSAEAAGPSLDLLQRQARLDDWAEEVNALDKQAATLQFAAPGGEIEAEDGPVEDGAPREAEANIAAVTAKRDRLARRLDMERASVRRVLGDERVGERSFRYDEWDHAGGVYRRGWCRLYEERLAPAEDGGEALLDVVAPHAKAVRRRFEQLRPAGYQRVKKTPDGDELDLEALVGARADVRVGVAPDDRVYSRR